MKLTLDVENTVTHRDGKLHLDPFETNNKLVMVGCLTDNGQEYLYRDNFNGVQELLDQATILIGHNIVHDLMWLWECDLKYDGPVFDTMLGEYILQRGLKEPLSLEACANRYDLATKKQDTMKDYFKNKVPIDEIPKQELSDYLSADLKATQELSDEIYKKLNTSEYSSLMDTVLLTNRVALTLARIYQTGFTVDKNKLDEVREEFEQEKVKIEERLNRQVHSLMGDTPINLNSPEQMSWIIYSRKPKDKSTWMNPFVPYMSKEDFKSTVEETSEIVYKTRADKCNECNGTGTIRKVKKDGNLYAKLPKCTTCSSLGYVFTPTTQVAGLKFNAPTVKWISANGFSVNKKMLQILQHVTKRTDSVSAYSFLHDLQR